MDIFKKLFLLIALAVFAWLNCLNILPFAKKVVFILIIAKLVVNVLTLILMPVLQKAMNNDVESVVLLAELKTIFKEETFCVVTTRAFLFLFIFVCLYKVQAVDYMFLLACATVLSYYNNHLLEMFVQKS